MPTRTLPVRPSLEQYKKQAKELVTAYRAGDAAATQRVRAHHPRFAKADDSGFKLADAQLVIAREHGFASWPKLVKQIEAGSGHLSPVARFEAAVDAVVSGDVAKLAGLLAESPELVRARSRRRHHSTLLHYVGANGVEGFRQHTPRNAVAVAELLLDAGAEVDAVADMYGGSTTLGLVATSLHPRLAGVQQPLIQLLLDRGAALDPAAAAGGRTLVHACLANGRPEAAEFLASRGARLDFEDAAGVGRLDVVRSCFDGGGAPAKEQMERALVLASTYGRTAVAELLLDRGVEIDVQVDGFTGVNAAATNGHLETVRLFLARGASIELRNRYGGTALEAALWGAVNRPREADYVPVIETLLAAGALVDPEVVPWWRQQQAASPEAHARILELLADRGDAG